MNTIFVRTCLLILIVVFLFSNPNPITHAQTDKITFAVIGDYGLAGQSEADVATLVKSWNPDFIVTVGDNNYQDGAAWSIDDNIGQYYADYIYPYKGKYGSGSATKRFFPSLGNHDWGPNAGKAYFDYFSFRNQQSYYDFVQGPVHFFVLNSNKEEPDGVSSTSAQAKWLKKTLLASTSAFQVVVFHHAPYSSGKHGSTPYMQWQFKEWGADAVLTGHDHVYERLLVDGIPYFVNGVGGAELYKFENTLPQSQARYNLDFGAMRVEATSTYMKFQFITRTGVLIDEYTIGQNNPSVTSITSLQSTSNASNVDFQVTFSESVTGVDVSDFILTTNLTGTSITNLTGSGLSYIVSTNSGIGDGTLRLDLADNDSITNSLLNPLGGLGIGNGNFTTGGVVTIDKTSPFVSSITKVNASPNNLASVDFLVTFSETVTGVDISDFSLITNSNAQITNVVGSGNLYTVSVSTGSGDDSLRLDFVDNDSVVDSAGNFTNSSFTTGETYNIDKTAPFVTSILRANATATSVEFTVSFSEPVTSIDGSDFFLSTLNGASISNVYGSGNVYTVVVKLNIGNDVVRVDLINNNSIIDSVGNLLNQNFTFGEAYSTSGSVPMVASIVRASNNPNNFGTVDFIVSFTESVTGVDASDFVISGIANANIVNIQNVNPFYILTVNTAFGDGTLKLDLIDDDSILNKDLIPLGGQGIGNANFTSGEMFTVDKTPPQVTSIVRASNNPTISSTVDFIVTFSEPVNFVDSSDFTVSTTNLNSVIINIQNVNPFYIVSVNTGAGSGSLRLDLMNKDITDIAGNGLSNGFFASGESYTIAKTTVNFPAPNVSTSKIKTLSNDSTPNISWGKVKNAQAYEIFVARDANFSQIAFIKTINTTDITIEPPLADGTYFVQVRAYNSELNPGKFSKSFSFTIDTTPPPVPILLSPANASNSVRQPTLQWTGNIGDITYEIQVDNNADFSSPEFTASTKNKSIRSNTLSKGTTYYWRVRVNDKAGNWSGWSSVFSFFVP